MIFKILDRYVFKKLFVVFFFLLIATVLIVEVIHFVMNSDNYIYYNLKFDEIIKYYISFTPFMINFLLPIISFISTVFITLRMTKNSEIIAALSTGTTFKRFIRPYFYFAILLSSFSFYLTGWLIPKANRTRIVFEIEYLGKESLSNYKNIHIKISEDKYIYVKTYDPYKNIGKNFTLETIDDKIHNKLHADSIEWNPENGSWKISKWNLRSMNGINESLKYGMPTEQILPLTPADFGDNFTIRDLLDNDQLKSYLENLQDKDSDETYLFLIEKYIRYMYPISIFLLMFAGILFSSKSMRSGMTAQIAIAFVLALAYVAFFMVSKGRAESHADHLLLTIWMPNIMFSIIVGIIYKLTPK